MIASRVPGAMPGGSGAFNCPIIRSTRQGMFAGSGGPPGDHVDMETILSSLSSQYKFQAMAICFWLLRQFTTRALAFARLSAGNSRAARIAMIAITTSNSMSVNAEHFSVLDVRIIPFTLSFLHFLPAAGRTRQNESEEERLCVAC